MLNTMERLLGGPVGSLFEPFVNLQNTYMGANEVRNDSLGQVEYV